MNSFDLYAKQLAQQIIQDLNLKRGSGDTPEKQAAVKARLREITGGPENIDLHLHQKKVSLPRKKK